MERMQEIQNKRVMVTGGAGFIGSELARQLYQSGAEVIVVDNLVNGKRENIADLPGDRVHLEVVDIRDQKKMAELVQGVDIIYHLAVLGVRHSIHSPYENHEVNAEATLRLLMLARQARVGRFVYVSSSEVYGTGSGVMSETYPAFPNTVYGGSKLAGESYTRAYYRTYDFPTVVIRPFNAYGPRSHHEGDSGEVIPKFVLRSMAGQPMIIFGDGMQCRDFTFVEDTARGILLAGISPNCLGATINLGAGYTITVNELANEVAKVLGISPKIEYIEQRPGDVLYLCAEVSLAKELLGFEVNTSLGEGLQKLVNWYRSLNVTPEKLLESEIKRNWAIGTNSVNS